MHMIKVTQLKVTPEKGVFYSFWDDGSKSSIKASVVCRVSIVEN